MSLLSIKNLKNKILFFILFFLIFSIFSGAIRQFYVNYRTKSIIKQKQNELEILEEKNRALKVRLKEVESPKFLDEQARRLLGVGDASLSATPVLPIESSNFEAEKEQVKAVEPSNFQKWRTLFGF